MSYIVHDPDEWETVSERRTCAYHRDHPGELLYIGCCGCSSEAHQRRRSPEEVARIKAERKRREEDEILRRADAIRAARSATAPTPPAGEQHG